jgi:signal transduction histidine kinase
VPGVWKIPDNPSKNMSNSKSQSGIPWRGVNLQLLVLLILPLSILLVAITFGSMSLHQKAMRTLVGERDERAALTSASAISDHINYRLLILRSLSASASTTGPTQLMEILASSEGLLAEFDAGLAFFDLDGSIFAATNDPGRWMDLDQIRSDLRSDKTAIANPINTPSTILVKEVNGGKMVIMVVGPEEGLFVAGAFSIENLARQALAPAFESNEAISLFLVDADHDLLFQIGPSTANSPLTDHPGVMAALNGQSGTTYASNGGKEHVIAFSPVQPMGWALVIEEPWAAVTNPMLRTTGSAPMVLIPVLLLALMALWFGANHIVKPLQALEAKAARLSWGDFKTIEEPVGGVEEISHLQRELIHLAQKVQLAQENLHGYIGAITSGQEDERRRLARELHDDTLQSLIALKQRIQLVHMNQVDEKTTASLLEIENMTEETINNLRRLTRALRPIYLEDLGLVAALEMLARETGQVMGISVEFQSLGIERRLSPNVELSLYRITQEALSNVARHANASHAWVKLNFSAETVTLEVSDDGVGFEVPKTPADFAPSGQFGLLGMYERAELIGAKLSIQSSEGTGMRLVVDY